MAMNVRVTKIETEASLMRATQNMSVWFMITSEHTAIEAKFEVKAASFDEGVNKARAMLHQFASDLVKETDHQAPS